MWQAVMHQEIESMETSIAQIQEYNTLCVHYEIVANSCYRKLAEVRSPLDATYFPYLVAALIAFGMGKQMGRGLRTKYDPLLEGFGLRLHNVLLEKQDELKAISSQTIVSIDLQAQREMLCTIYTALATDGELCQKGNNFHVGATKLLHFLYPELFPIIDSNVAATLRKHFDISYKNSTQPGYSHEKYLESMLAIQKYICTYGSENFRMLEAGTPITRIFDKLAYVSGADL